MAVSAPVISPSASPLTRTKSQPKWRPDTASNSCLCCGTSFSLLWCRRHHCRACGELVCAACSPYAVLDPEFGYEGAVRVCKDCTSRSPITMSPSASAASTCSANSDSDGEEDDELLVAAIELIASKSVDKHSKLSYAYFVQSEAVNWLVDAGVVKNRSSAVSLFRRMIDEDIVTLKGDRRSSRAAFYVLSEEVCAFGPRLSQYDRAMHSETNKCSNCSQSFLESLTSAPGFCSIDCKTAAQFSQDDSARIRRML